MRFHPVPLMFRDMLVRFMEISNEPSDLVEDFVAEVVIVRPVSRRRVIGFWLPRESVLALRNQLDQILGDR